MAHEGLTLMAGPTYEGKDDLRPIEPPKHDQQPVGYTHQEKEVIDVRIVGGLNLISPEKEGVSSRVANNPALIGGLASAIVTSLVSLGLDPELSSGLEELIVYALIILGVGGTAGVAVRQSVTPVRKLNKKGRHSNENSV